MANTDPHVLIAGGGPSGLLCSILLNNIGISSTVVERAKEPDEGLQNHILRKFDKS